MLAHFQKKKTGFCLGADGWRGESEGARGVAARNRNRGGKNPVLLACHLHADDTLNHYMEGRCSY